RLSPFDLADTTTSSLAHAPVVSRRAESTSSPTRLQPVLCKTPEHNSCYSGLIMPLLADLVVGRPVSPLHGPLLSDAPLPARNGYLLTGACPCGWCSGGGALQRMRSLIFLHSAQLN